MAKANIQNNKLLNFNNKKCQHSKEKDIQKDGLVPMGNLISFIPLPYSYYRKDTGRHWW
jgi:hypothetical protein